MYVRISRSMSAIFYVAMETRRRKTFPMSSLERRGSFQSVFENQLSAPHIKERSLRRRKIAPPTYYYHPHDARLNTIQLTANRHFSSIIEGIRGYPV